MPANPTAVQAGTTIETGTLLLAVATFFGAMVGGLTQIALSWWNRRREKTNLRLALRSEMTSQKGLDMDDPGLLTAFDDLNEVFPTPVYESNTQKLGSLSDEEAKQISHFYTALMAHRGMTGQSPPGEEAKEAIENMNESVEELRTQAIDVINDHL